jgi:hypothetical protein
MSVYGCHNKPRPTQGAALPVQDGWLYTGITCVRPNENFKAIPSRIPRMVDVPYVMTVPCQYTQQHASDPLCSGCEHRKEAP